MTAGSAWSAEAAIRIGDRLVHEAVPQGGGVTWWASERDPDGGRWASRRRLAEGTLYRGTSGIALFLTELGRVTGEGRYTRTAHGALLHAFEDAPLADMGRWGLYSGLAGLIYVTGRHLAHAESAELRDHADRAIRRIASAETWGRNYDLIGGLSGTILALLGVSDVFDPDGVEEICVRLGDVLIDAAIVEAEGLSWPSGGPRGANLCGLAHGAAGIGWALLELFQRTGFARFRIAAEEAFAYEDLWFDADRGNWADLRNGRLHQLLQQDDGALLARMVEAGDPIPLYRLKFMSAWCHGAPGIGVTRARAFELLGDDRYRHQTAAAMDATLRVLHGGGDNHSLCHGFVGNAVAVIRMARAVGDQVNRLRARRMLENVVRSIHARNGRFRSGGMDRERPDPTLLLGEAGVGLALLDLEQDVACAVLPVPHQPGRPALNEAGCDTLRGRILEDVFPHSVQVLGPSGASELASRTDDHALPMASAFASALSARAEGDDRLEGALRLDALARERGRSGFDRSYAYYTETSTDDRAGTVELCVAPWIEIHEGPGAPSVLVHPDGAGRWVARSIRPEMAVLLGLFAVPTTVDTAVGRLADPVRSDRPAVETWARAQITQLIEAGIVVPARLAHAIDVEIARMKQESGSAPTSPTPAAEQDQDHARNFVRV